MFTRLNIWMTRWTWMTAIGNAAQLIKENERVERLPFAVGHDAGARQRAMQIGKAISRANFYSNRYRKACGLAALPDRGGLNVFELRREGHTFREVRRVLPDGNVQTF